MRKITPQDKANLSMLMEIVATHEDAEGALQALEAQVAHLPTRLAGARFAQLRASMNSNDGNQMRSHEPRLQALYALMYAQLAPPPAL